MIVLIVIGTLILLFACYLWMKLFFILVNKLYRFVFRKKIQEKENPYIIEQKARMKNDLNFEEYQKWMRKKGDGFPIQKVMTSDEKQQHEKIKKYL
ncbi:hypothetical protein [Flavobacterium sp. 3-210]